MKYLLYALLTIFIVSCSESNEIDNLASVSNSVKTIKYFVDTTLVYKNSDLEYTLSRDSIIQRNIDFMGKYKDNEYYVKYFFVIDTLNKKVERINLFFYSDVNSLKYFKDSIRVLLNGNTVVFNKAISDTFNLNLGKDSANFITNAIDSSFYVLRVKYTLKNDSLELDSLTTIEVTENFDTLIPLVSSKFKYVAANQNIAPKISLEFLDSNVLIEKEYLSSFSYTKIESKLDSTNFLVSSIKGQKVVFDFSELFDIEQYQIKKATMYVYGKVTDHKFRNLEEYNFLQLNYYYSYSVMYIPYSSSVISMDITLALAKNIEKGANVELKALYDIPSIFDFKIDSLTLNVEVSKLHE